MFCGKCGAKNLDDATFCAQCGAKFNNQPIGNENKSTMVIQTDDRNRKIGMIAVGVIVIAAVIAMILIFGGRSYKRTVDQFCKASFAIDAKAIFNLLPDAMIDYALEEGGYGKNDLDELIEESEEELQYQVDNLESYLGEDWKVSHKIVGAEDITGKELRELKESYEDVDVKVSAAKTVEVELTVKGGETEENNTMDISVIKVGRSWYLDFISMGNLF